MKDKCKLIKPKEILQGNTSTAKSKPKFLSHQELNELQIIFGAMLEDGRIRRGKKESLLFLISLWKQLGLFFYAFDIADGYK